ncbi:MAG: helix-turn-helix transcriptional regulator [Desulforhopalus sp.]
MDYYMMTDDGITLAIGQRFKKLRLRKNLTQEELASRAMLSISTVKSLETGKGKLKSMIAILRELGSLDDLDSFLPDPGLSPMQIAKMNGVRRQRATGKLGKKSNSSKEQEW